MKGTVAVLTDFGLADAYVGIVKAVMLGINPHIRLIDISHGVTNHSILQGALLLAGSFSYFPEGTIFLAVVDPQVGSSRRGLVLKTKHYYFVGPDNGVLSLAASNDTIKETAVLENRRFFRKDISSTFQARDIFAPAAAHLSCGLPLKAFGRPAETIEKIEIPQPVRKGKTLVAKILYIDHFGNLITNIKKEDNPWISENNFVATLNNKKITKSYSHYAESKNNEPFFVIGSFGYLEISLKNKSAQKYFSLKQGQHPGFKLRFV